MCEITTTISLVNVHGHILTKYTHLFFFMSILRSILSEIFKYKVQYY